MKYFYLYLASAIIGLIVLAVRVYVSWRHTIEDALLSILIKIWIGSVLLMIVSDIWKTVLIFKDGRNEKKDD